MKNDDFIKQLIASSFVENGKFLAMDAIRQALIYDGFVSGSLTFNLTFSYAVRWIEGQTFDFSKSQTQRYRARLRKIGIDIAKPCPATFPVYSLYPCVIKQAQS